MPTTKQIISGLGFESTEAFQRAWNLGTRLKVDGIIGPKTREAAAESWERHEDGKGDLSAHFSAREFRCKCGGKLAGCKTVWVHRDLLVALERTRGDYYPHGLTIVSGYRCPKHNEAVGGAPGSQHIEGRAADIPGRVKLQSLKARRWFTGLGYRKSDGIVVHVDVRSERTVSDPATWPYAKW